MAHGTWEDFTSKWGFSDGNGVDNIDFEARKLLVKALNANPDMVKAKVRALEFDRPGWHNPCLVVHVEAKEGKSDEQLLADWEADALPEAPLPEAVDEVVEDLICEAYEDVYASLRVPKRKTKAKRS